MEPLMEISPEMKKTHGQFVSWTAPANIALIKYWGKTDDQLPMNPNLSMSLEKSLTGTTVYFRESDEFRWQFLFEGKSQPAFEKKLHQFFQRSLPVMKELSSLDILIESSNTFPHSAGIASSASSMAALALCLLSIREIISGKNLPEQEFLMQASALARLGSGSACRSVYGGFVTWGNIPSLKTSSDAYASELPFTVHPEFRELNDAILVVNQSPKKVSSTAGHELMRHHPFAKARFRTAVSNTGEMLKILENGDVESFITLVESEA